MSVDYLQEKLFHAVGRLVEDGSIQQRLNDAAVLLLVPGVSPEHIGNPELEKRFAPVYRRLSKGAIGPEGTIPATTDRLSDEEGSELAREIFALFCRATELARTPTGLPDLAIRNRS